MIGRVRHLVLRTAMGAALLLGLLTPPLSALADQAGPPSSQQHSSQNNVREAARWVDEAWETFHRAALGGTLASPAVQTQIEHNLHEARSLLLQARDAEERGDHPERHRLVLRIRELTTDAIRLSREEKK